MKKIIEKYDLQKMIEVATDRACDYADIKDEFEEKFEGEMKSNSDKHYEYGYGKILEDVVELLTELKNYSK